MNNALEGLSALTSPAYPMVLISSIVKERSEKGLPSQFNPLSVGQGGVTKQLEGVAKSQGDDAKKIVRKGDLVINSRSDRRGAAGLSRYEGVVSLVYTVLEPNTDILDSKYGHYLLRCTAFQEEFFKWGTGIVDDLWSTNYTRMSRIRVPLPPLQTQRRIADYLDRETGQIDAMIDKLAAVVQELLERRSGVIQRHTINAGGSLTRLKFCADVSLGKTFQGVRKNSSERFVNYVRAASIQTYGLELDDQRMWMTDAELDKYNLLSGDVLIVEGGAGYGRSVVLSKAMPGWGFQNHVIRVRPNKSSDGRFLNYCVKAHLDAGLIDILVDGATIPALSSEKARELPVLAAPLEEQRRMADHLDNVTSKIDVMLAKVAQLKDLLTERRAALITDVVTGRKDVA